MAQLSDVREKVVTLELGGKERTLKFDLNAFAELEERFGSVEEAMRALQQGGMKAIRTILWVGLIHEEVILDEKTGEPIGYNITPYQVGGWIAPRQLPQVSDKLTEAMQLGMPDIESNPELKAKAEQIMAELNEKEKNE